LVLLVCIPHECHHSLSFFSFMAASNTPQPNKIFIGGLSRDVSNERFKQFWEQEFGETTDACVMNDQMGRSRGFGFVVFREASVVEKVLSAGPIEIDGTRVECKRAIPKGESSESGEGSRGSSRTKKVFVGGLSKDTTNDEFKKYFEQFGAISEATVMTDQHGVSRGFGFVIFENESSVEEVLAAKELIIAGKTVDAKRAIPQGQAPLPRRLQDRRGPERDSGGRYGYARGRDDRGYDRYDRYPRYPSPPRGYDRDARSYYDYYQSYPPYSYPIPPPAGGGGKGSHSSSSSYDYYAQFAPPLPVYRDGDFPSGSFAYSGYSSSYPYSSYESNAPTPYGKEKRGGSSSSRSYHPYR